MLHHKRLLLYFLLILSISAAGNLLILRNGPILRLNLPAWYLLHILWISAVVYAGYACWKSYPEKWLRVLWLGIYLAAALIFFTLGFIDVFLHQFPYVIRKDISKIRVFFFGPVPFVIVYLIYRLSMKSGKTPTGKTEQPVSVPKNK